MLCTTTIGTGNPGRIAATHEAQCLRTFVEVSDDDQTTRPDIVAAMPWRMGAMGAEKIRFSLYWTCQVGSAGIEFFNQRGLQGWRELGTNVVGLAN